MNATAKIVIGAIAGGVSALAASVAAKRVLAAKKKSESEARILDMSRYLDNVTEAAKKDYEAALGTTGEILRGHVINQENWVKEFDACEQALEYIDAGLSEKARAGKIMCQDNLDRLAEEV